MSPTTLVRLAWAGNRADRVRMILTWIATVACSMSLLSVATLLFIGDVNDWRNPYINALYTKPLPFLELYVVLGLVALVSLLFVAQCSRIGAPARDRRLAAYRLSGGTPRQVAGVIAAETGMAAIAGTVLGFVLHFGGRIVLESARTGPVRLLPTDVLPPWWLSVAIFLAVPVAAISLSLAESRRVLLTPFGVARGAKPRRPRAWPAIVLAIGGVVMIATVVATPLAFGGINHAEPPVWVGVLLKAGSYVSIPALVIGLVFGNRWFAQVTGGFLSRMSGRPAILLASRRLLADPASGAWMRALIGLMVLGASYSAYRRSRWFPVEEELRAFGPDAIGYGGSGSLVADGLVFNAITAAALVVALFAAAGLVVLAAEQAVTNRRSLATAVAAGTPRGVLIRASLIQLVAPVVPPVVVASIPVPFAMALAPPRVSHGPTLECLGTDPAANIGNCPSQPTVLPDIPIPVGELVAVSGGALAAVAIAAAIGVAFLRTATRATELRTH